LARSGGAREVLLANEAVAAFLAWIADTPVDFHAPTKATR